MQYIIVFLEGINAEGHVIAQAVGAIDAATLQKGIDMITN